MLGKLNDWFHQYLGIPYKLVIVYDEGVGTPIVFFHGIASNSQSWLPLIPLLKNSFRCIAIDLLGFGSSPKPEWSSYSLNDHLNSLHATIRHLKLNTPFVLIGHSMGSIIATQYSSRYPKEVSHLYLLSPPIVTDISQRKSRRLILAKSSYASVYRYLREHKRFTIAGVQYVRKFIKTTPFDLTEASWRPFVSSLEECIEKQRDFDLDLRQVRCSIDVFYGTRDRVISIKNIEALGVLPNVTLHPVPAWHRINMSYAIAVSKQLK